MTSCDSGRGLVLVVEDEESIADLLRLYLSRDGFAVSTACDGDEALRRIRELRPSLVLLDVGLPGVDGIEVCREMRAAQDWTPVIFCTARDEEVERIVGLELGADDYITKPFSPREVVARVKAVLRRADGSPARSAVVTVGDVRLERQSRRCWISGRELSLTPTEFDLLGRLMEHPGRVFGRDELLKDVWGYVTAVTSRTVDVHVAQLRGKLGAPGIIRTARGVGYALDAPGPKD